MVPSLNRRLPILLLHLIVLLAAGRGKTLAQEAGNLTGIITSQASGEALVGINLTVEGTKLGASTDLDGKYVIHNIPAGTSTLKASAIGYAAKTVTGIVINAGKTTTLNLSLAEEGVNMQEVVVTAEEVRSAETAVLAERKRAATISDGVGAEQIKRSPDATSGDALKRVTGISIVDNKFVFVRGITDRYNETTLDGAPVTSTEVGKKGYSFDLLPANLIENTSIIKTPTPDLPGDFSGGLVQLHTQDFPTENSLRVSLGSAYNNVTTGNDFYRSQGGSRDWIGFDNGVRGYPGDQQDQNDIAKNLPNTWAPHTQSALPNKSLLLALGRRLELSQDGPSLTQLGFVGDVTYKNAYRRTQKTNDDYVLDRFSKSVEDEYNVLWGAIANLSLKFDGLHKISFKNSFNQSGSDVVTVANIDDNSNASNDRYTTVRWTQRSSYTGQLTGEHNVPSIGGLTVQWRGAVSSSRREDPDWKEAFFYRDITDPSQPYYPAINKRYWGKLNDRSRSLGIDLSLPLSAAKLKVGGFAESGDANYEVRYFNVSPSQYPHPIPDSLAYLPLETIYSPGNFGVGKFLFKESTRPEDTYQGNQSLYAGFVMADVPFVVLSNRFRFVGGARLENLDQHVHVPHEGGTILHSRNLNNDLLPSLNLTYFLNDLTNVRLAYSHSVNRPDFRELATTGFFDFIKYELVEGNPNLRRSLIHNYDARLEIFPAVGELAALSYFYKVISDPIEEYLLPSSSRFSHTWINSPNATDWGWEIEVRKSLSFLGSYLANFSVMGNYTRVQSNVEIVDPYTGKFLRNRPMQGQSPYVMNLSLLFTEPTLGTSVSLLYNKFGSRLEEVGAEAADIYEEPRDLVDLALTQPLYGLFELKFTIANLANKDRVLTRASFPYEEATTGRTFTIQLSAGL